MEESFKQKLRECGADVETTVKRFMGNEAIYEKFVRKFPQDQNYRMLGEHMDSGNYEEAFKCAHTLKGVSANLGFDPVYKAVSNLVEELRGRKPEEVDKGKAEAEWQEVSRAYRRFVEVIDAQEPSS